MIKVVSSLFISSGCPKYLQPICEEIKKALYHNFESEETFNRFMDGIRTFISNLPGNRSKNVVMLTTGLGASGNMTISSSMDKMFVLMNYVTVLGCVHVSKDGQHLYQQEDIERGQAELA